MAIEVTVRDTETGETATETVDDYVVICAAPCHIAHRTAHRSGTHTLTIRNAVKAPYTVTLTHEPPPGVS